MSMEGLPLSRHEEGRAAALRSYDIMDTLPEQEYDNLTQLAARLCGTPIAYISFLDEKIQWFKSNVGLGIKQINRDISFCRYTILDDDLFEVPDPFSDSRFTRNPMVTGVQKISYYAGVPLINKEGYRLGTLAVMAQEPHSLNDAQKGALKTLAQSVMTLLELRRATRNGGKAKAEPAPAPVPQPSLSAPQYEMPAPIAEPLVIVEKVVDDSLVKALSEQLAQTEALARTGSWEYDISTGRTTWSRAMYDLMDTDIHDSSVDKSILNYVAPADARWLAALINELTGLDTGSDFQRITKKGRAAGPALASPARRQSDIIEFTIITNKGMERHLRGAIRKVTDADANVKLVGIMHDISGSKVIEKVTFVPVEQKKETYAGAPFGYHTIDSRGYFTDINDTELDWLGYTREEVVGQMVLKNVLTDESIRAYADSQLLFEKNGKLRDLHLGLRRKDGTEMIVSANLNVIYGEGGAHVGTKAILFDITKLKKTNDALEESEAMYRTLIEESAQMLFTADTQGRFTYVSNRLKKTIGYTNKDLLGKLFASIYDGEWRKKAIAFYNKQLLDQIEETTYLLPIIIRTGERLWIEQVATLIKKNDTIVGYRFALYDITERLKTQEAMQEAARLAMEAKEMQQTFLGKMSHEIRTPMNGVVGMVNLLNTTKLTQEQQEFVDGIKESSVNMIRIINDILDVTKIQSGKLVFEDTDLVLKNLVNGVIFALKANADRKGVKLISQIDSQIPDTLIADPVRLNQVLLNLADNALKFTEKGSISIQVRVKESRPDGMMLEFIVADTGIGIPENKIQAIFESFTQAQSDTTRKYGGTGLGLTIAKQLIEQQGGEIKVISRVGEGTTFTFTFNFKLKKTSEQEEQQKKEAASIIHPLEGYSILLVEDNVMNQRVAKFTIEKWGAKIAIADRGQKALDILANEQFDLILMDIQMPEMNGIQTTEKIRTELNINTPIMAMTASVMQNEKDNCVRAGMNDYISKPFNPAELNHKIWDLLPKKDVQQEKRITNINYLRNAVGGDLNAIKEILEIYLSKTPPILDALDNELAVKNMENVQSLVHNLKNSVGIIGADGLFHILDTIEANLHKKEASPETMTMIKKMMEMARRSVKEIIDEYKILYN